jgi:DNA-binding transcriptional LysR family regulator
MDNLDWNLIRSFLAVADGGSLSLAAERLGLSQPTLGRQIDEIERQTGLVLFVRSRSGMRLTDTGTALVDDARAIEREANHFMLHAAGKSDTARGTVRVTASQIVSSFLLPPLLVELKQAEPEIEVELVASNLVANLLARDADIAIRMVRPKQNDLITSKINDMALGAFAHRSYLEKNGRPATADALFQHRLVGYDRDDTLLRGMADFGIRGDRSMFAFRTDDHVSYWHLVRSGAGIGFLAAFLAQTDPMIEALNIGLPIPVLPMWLTSHQELRSSLKVRRVMDFLRDRLSKLDLRLQI